MINTKLIHAINGAVERYIEEYDIFDQDPHIRINPASLNVTIVNGRDMLAEIEDSNETVEDAAGAQGAASELSTDFQVTQNPDFYALNRLVIVMDDGHMVPNEDAIKSIAANYPELSDLSTGL